MVSRHRIATIDPIFAFRRFTVTFNPLRPERPTPEPDIVLFQDPSGSDQVKLPDRFEDLDMGNIPDMDVHGQGRRGQACRNACQYLSSSNQVHETAQLWVDFDLVTMISSHCNAIGWPDGT